MKRIEWILSFVLLLLALSAANSYAASPREQFKQMVEQLQQSPGDTALREKLIKLAQKLKPAPAVPEEARRPLVRGNAVMSDAKGADDYARAAKLYEEAITIAPWWGDPYFNLAKALELKQDYAGATQSLKFYLLAGASGNEARQAQDHIYVLEEKHDAQAKALEVKQHEEQARQKVQSLVDELNRRFRGKDFWYSLHCVPPGHDMTENFFCNYEERRGTNWHTWKNSDRPDALSFAPTDDGKIQFSTGFSEPSWEGTVMGNNVEDIRWKGRTLNRQPAAWMEPVWIKMDYSGEWYKVCYASDGNPDDRPDARIGCVIYKISK